MVITTGVAGLMSCCSRSWRQSSMPEESRIVACRIRTSGEIVRTCSITCAALVARVTEKPLGARMVSRDQIQISWSFATSARGGRAWFWVERAEIASSCCSPAGGLVCTNVSVWEFMRASADALCKSRAEHDHPLAGGEGGLHVVYWQSVTESSLDGCSSDGDILGRSTCVETAVTPQFCSTLATSFSPAHAAQAGIVAVTYCNKDIWEGASTGTALGLDLDDEAGCGPADASARSLTPE